MRSLLEGLEGREENRSGNPFQRFHDLLKLTQEQVMYLQIIIGVEGKDSSTDEWSLETWVVFSDGEWRELSKTGMSITSREGPTARKNGARF